LEYPDADHHNNENIQNRFDARRHGNEPVDQVESNSNNNQRDDDIQQRHFSILLNGEEQFATQSQLVAQFHVCARLQFTQLTSNCQVTNYGHSQHRLLPLKWQPKRLAPHLLSFDP
jgi:hypothetical protein